jgi:hypothetical protein
MALSGSGWQLRSTVEAGSQTIAQSCSQGDLFHTTAGACQTCAVGLQMEPVLFGHIIALGAGPVTASGEYMLVLEGWASQSTGSW